jgi:hypothetical protein
MYDVKSHFRLAILLGIGLALGFTAKHVAAESPDAVVKLPQDIEFKGPLSGPPQTVVVYGDPTKPGVFVTRVRSSVGSLRFHANQRCFARPC